MSYEKRELFDAVCDKCHKKCQVPFKPTPGKPVYCRECFREIRQNRPPRTEPDYSWKAPKREQPKPLIPENEEE